MNPASQRNLAGLVQERLAFFARRAGPAVCLAFAARAGAGPTVGRVYVINLDRRPDRWRTVRAELARVRGAGDVPLVAVTRRHPAVDGRTLGPSGPSGPHRRAGEPPADIDGRYSLADQLFVQPVPALQGRPDLDAVRIQMTPAEVAVAQSHVQVWRLVAEGDDEHALILEDDAYFTRGFGRAFGAVWMDVHRPDGRTPFDVLFLSYKEVDEGAEKQPVSRRLFRPVRGIWQLSGYVLSRAGARRLLGLLPVRGPVDLWINHQIARLDVLATRRPVVRQQPGNVSSNSYSVLPVLAAAGVVTRERPLLARPTTLPAPVFASGPPGSGLHALATALSMLGYRCCSDTLDLPSAEAHRLRTGRRNRVFDAYVNVGTVAPEHWPALARLHPRARFVTTVPVPAPGYAAGAGHEPAASPNGPVVGRLPPGSHLTLPNARADKWQALVDLLGCDYPTHAYPVGSREREPAMLAPVPRVLLQAEATALRWDRSPWVVPPSQTLGFALPGGPTRPSAAQTVHLADTTGGLDTSRWLLRDDTFPGNLCLFQPGNVKVRSGEAEIALRREQTGVRDYTSGAVAANRRHAYGHHSALIKPPGVPGLVTGLFLHRDEPRQEIDIEFLGKDPTRMLVNVFYNPGRDGDRLQYGYRGTPVLLKLGFDASADFHLYEIDWQPDSIRWSVDGRVVHERHVWQPTPVPDLPAQFNLNLWHSRSPELAGALAVSALPARARFRDVRYIPHL